MAVQFVGYEDVRHVAQPADSELCFASIIAAASDEKVSRIHSLLHASGVSLENGETAPMDRLELELEGAELAIEAFQTPFMGAKTPEDVMELMEQQFEDGQAVILLHKKNGDDADGRYHWTLLTGYHVQDTESDTLKSGPIYTIDPLREEATYLTRPIVIDMVKRSMDYGSVYAYSLGQGPIITEAEKAAANRPVESNPVLTAR